MQREIADRHRHGIRFPCQLVGGNPLEHAAGDGRFELEFLNEIFSERHPARMIRPGGARVYTVWTLHATRLRAFTLPSSHFSVRVQVRCSFAPRANPNANKEP